MKHSMSSSSRRDCDPFVDDLENRITHKNVLLARPRRTGQLEMPAVELLVDHDGPCSVPREALHAVTTLADKNEQGA